MSKKTDENESGGQVSSISKKGYKDGLHRLQVELVKLQRHFIKCDDKILIILEGRDASGKDGTIKRIVQHLSPRETRVVALGKPSDRDRTRGTSSVTSRICQQHRNSCCLTAAGTTARA
jgi:polyphosphate kinase 2 (PPK2 family)